MIGAVVPSYDYALYARTTSALKRRLDECGYSLVLAEHHYDLAAEVRITKQLAGHGVDAFVFVGLHHDPALFTLLENYGRPYVLTWGVDPMHQHPDVGPGGAGLRAGESLAIALDHEDDDPGTTWNERARKAKPDWMSPRMAWRAIQSALPRNAIISSDIGNKCAIGNAYPTFD